ncbi:uncharacterized protein KGF55_005313 [Candida pseudojiufengensis]|uniref:uncharacterized protein n=1 Tax=Candida pseudojiufengensis TaxID=497109 RepID=UPI0022243982|nr:uncharacterized protein KGF55_005313 [Candida pseudojiufengensis]KAI5959485.1 hypothetical protein KGF55_005313 [Candida pseudojiufengensis]
MTITSIIELPIDIVEKIINLVDDRDCLLRLARITYFKDIIYKRLFPNLNIFHKYYDKADGKFISFYFVSKFLNFLDDYNYVPNEILTNIDTLYELFKIKHVSFKSTKINLIIHPYHTIEDLEFSFKNFKINSITVEPDFDYQLTGKHYDKTLYLSQFENENVRKLTFPNTLDGFYMKYNNIFLRNLPCSLHELILTEIDDLNSIKLPLSLRSLTLTKCKISGVKLDLRYLHQLKNFEIEGIFPNHNDFSPEILLLPSSIESICLSFYDFRSLNNLSDYKNLKVLKLMRCDGSILLFNTILPPHLEHLSIEKILPQEVNPDDIISHGETMNLNNVAIDYPPEDQPEADSLYKIIGGNIFPSTLRILKLNDIWNLMLEFQLNLPNLEELEISNCPFSNPLNFINENLINLKKLTIYRCFNSIELVKFPKNLEYLNLQDNGITSFKPFNFIHLIRLKHLIVSDIRLSSITEQIAPNLKILDVSTAGVNKLYHQKNLEKLTLTTLASLDDIYINSLKYLKLTITDDYFSSNFYDYKFDSCYNLKELKLSLQTGNISSLTFPDTIEILHINFNYYVAKKIENDSKKNLFDISNCYNLKNFKLENGNLEQFNFDNLPKNLEELSIFNMKVKSIHGSLKNLKNLKSLNLESNRIDNNGLKNFLFSSPKLEIINLNWNYIDNIDCIRIEDCPRLVELKLKMDSSTKLYITDEFREKLKTTCPRLSVIRGNEETN